MKKKELTGDFYEILYPIPEGILIEWYDDAGNITLSLEGNSKFLKDRILEEE